MTESARAEALQAVQLRLFELAVEREQLTAERKKLKRTFLRLIASGKKRCRDLRCASQGEEMDADQFYIDTRYSDNLYPYCRECKTRMVKARQRKAA